MTPAPTREELLALIDRTDRPHAMAIAGNGDRPWLVLILSEDAKDEDAPSRLADFILGYWPLKTKEETDRFLLPKIDEGLLVCTRDVAADAPPSDDWWIFQAENVVFAACVPSSSRDAREEAELDALDERFEAFHRVLISRAPVSSEEFLEIDEAVSGRTSQLCAGNVELTVPPGNYYDASIHFLRDILRGFLAAKGIEGVLRDRTALIHAGPRDVLAPYLAWFPGEKPGPPRPPDSVEVCPSVPEFVAEIFVEATALSVLRSGFCALGRLGVREYWVIDAR
ncbi:MAG: Uma2 family endonuclease [Methylacidiphilaceae bacterium]|nr:Uma2 family endonuclease [Candidatus Methylacidiphilaceae bacterium]